MHLTLKKLELISFKNETYTYFFSSGVNFFQGKNSSGKTVFYNFIDFMLGEENNKLYNRTWFKDTLKTSRLHISNNGLVVVLERSFDNSNKVSISNGEEYKDITIGKYKDILNRVIFNNIENKTFIKEFTNQNLSYRSFMVFNMLGEKRLGYITNFFDKENEIKYRVKMPVILNYIFNKNVSEIILKKRELINLNYKKDMVKKEVDEYKFIVNQINIILLKMGYKVKFKNKEQILNIIDELQKANTVPLNHKKTITSIDLAIHSYKQQLKVMITENSQIKMINQNDRNLQKILNKFENLISQNNNYKVYIEPLNKILKESENNIVFGDYFLNKNKIDELKGIIEKLKVEKMSIQSDLIKIEHDEYQKNIYLLNQLVDKNIQDPINEYENLQKVIKSLKNEIIELEGTVDSDRINSITKRINELYFSAKSSISEEDKNVEGFKLIYVKDKNAIQVNVKDIKNKSDVKIEYIGSYARQTMIQLSAYLSFIEMINNRDDIPAFPLVIIDHISKPFDDENIQSIGKIISKFYENPQNKNIQIIMFDDQEDRSLGIDSDTFNRLNDSMGKTGFNPFYCKE